MKFRIEVDDFAEEEVLIRCKSITNQVERLQRFFYQEMQSYRTLVFYQGDEEYYFPVEDVFFFETGGENVFAHTALQAYRVKQRLYELEELLPHYFARVSKGTILNARHVFSLQKNLASVSLVKFSNSHKQVFVSRHYYKSLKQRLEERSMV